MKVIGKTENGFIIEASNLEIDSLLAANHVKKGKYSELKVGEELTFTTALTNLNLIKDLSLSDNYRALHELKQAKEELEKAIKIVEGLNAPLTEVQKQIKLRRQ
jgi:hypothetical protein